MKNLDELFEIDPDDDDQQLAMELADADGNLLEDLVKLRNAKGLTQKDVARRIGRHQTAVSHFEKLGADPHLSTVRRYARAIGARIIHVVTDASAPVAEEHTHGVGVFYALDEALDYALANHHTTAIIGPGTEHSVRTAGSAYYEFVALTSSQDAAVLGDATPPLGTEWTSLPGSTLLGQRTSRG